MGYFDIRYSAADPKEDWLGTQNDTDPHPDGFALERSVRDSTSSAMSRQQRAKSRFNHLYSYVDWPHWAVRNRLISGPDDIMRFPGTVYDYAIAIGIGTMPDGRTANGRSAACARAAYETYLEGAARGVILSGGNSVKGGKTEALAMLHYLEDRYGPIDREKVILEDKSRDTDQNARFTLAIMQERQAHTAVVFPEALHSRRVRSNFRREWRGSGCEFIVVRTFGEYGDSSGAFTTPLGFLAFNTAVTLAGPLVRIPFVKKYLFPLLGR